MTGTIQRFSVHMRTVILSLSEAPGKRLANERSIQNALKALHHAKYVAYGPTRLTSLGEAKAREFKGSPAARTVSPTVPSLPVSVPVPTVKAEPVVSSEASEAVALIAEKLGVTLPSNASVLARLDALEEAVSKPTLGCKVTVYETDSRSTDVSNAHPNLDLLLTLTRNATARKKSPLLVGPSGTGKTHGARTVADILGVPCFVQSFSADASAPALLGYTDVAGNTVRTPFRECYEHGGVFVLDEMDACPSEVLIALNGALDAPSCGFPDGKIARHESFYFVGTANTNGTGRNSRYNSRNALDVATLNRFTVVSWSYDASVEMAVSGASEPVYAAFSAVRERVMSDAATSRDLTIRDLCAYVADFANLGQSVAANLLFAGWDSQDVNKLWASCSEAMTTLGARR
jgi:hypothetical protein